MSKKLNLKPVVFMLIITVIYTLVLATINHVTADRVKLNALVRQQRSFLYALNIDTKGKDAETISSLYNNHISEIQVNGSTLYEAYVDEQLVAYILPIKGYAVWGELNALIAMSTDFKSILGLDILSHSETPGLGGRIDELSFKEQFRNIIINSGEDFNYISYKPDPTGQVDSITGATGTSNALRRILNENLDEFFSNVREGL